MASNGIASGAGGRDRGSVGIGAVAGAGRGNGPGTSAPMSCSAAVWADRFTAAIVTASSGPAG
jgi:hypothetical protein